MVRTVLVLSSEQAQFPDSQSFQVSTQGQKPHLLLCLMTKQQDYVWLRSRSQEYESCCIKVVLVTRKRDLALGCLLAKQIQGMLHYGDLGSSDVLEWLAELVRRVESVQGQVFDLLVRQPGFLTVSDLMAAAHKHQKPQDQAQMTTWLTEVSGRSPAPQITKREFIEWWMQGRPGSSHLIPQILTETAHQSNALSLCGLDFSNMLLSPDVEDVESSFSGSLIIGAEVSETPNLSLKTEFAVKQDRVSGLQITLTLQVQESIDVSAAKTALEAGVASFFNVLKPLDRKGTVFPLLKTQYSMGHRKIILQLSIPSEGVWAEFSAKFQQSIQPLLESGFAQFVEIQAKSEASLQEMALDQERTMLEWLTDSLEVSVDGFYWGFYRELLSAIVLPHIHGPLQLALTMVLAALKDGAVEMEFGSAEQLPSFVLRDSVHSEISHYPFLSLFRIRRLLTTTTEATAQAARQLLQVLSTNFDSSTTTLQVRFETLEVSADLKLPGLFTACV